MTTTEQCKIIKHYLSSRFLGKKFSVSKGTGTASHWINIKVPRDMIQGKVFSYSDFVSMAENALKQQGETPSTFDSDDGIGSRMSCISILSL